jgi:hypothetical protein
VVLKRSVKKPGAPAFLKWARMYESHREYLDREWIIKPQVFSGFIALSEYLFKISNPQAALRVQLIIRIVSCFFDE